MTATTASSTTSPRRPSRRWAKVATLLAVPAAVAVSGLVVSHASYSAYSATTVNPTSNWTTGSVALSDDDTNTAAFTAKNQKPGSTGKRCIVVTSTGSLPAAVKLYATAASTTNNLASYIDLTVTQGTGGSFGDCAGYTPLATGGTLFTGTAATFGSSYTGYANGLGGWATTGAPSESRTYQISYTVNTAAPDSTQGGTAAFGLTWEAQNS
jgi:hypothetical protein